jgi:hypothetical protein
MMQAVGVAGGLIGAWGMLVFKRGPSAGTVFVCFAASRSRAERAVANTCVLELRSVHMLQTQE